MTRFFTVLLLVLAAACGEITTNMPSQSTVVPPALAGEWTGLWTSSAGDVTGELTMRVQEFAGEVVLHIATDLPCIDGMSFLLQMAPAAFTTHIGGQQVLNGEVTAPSAMIGTYACAADVGSWQATRIRTLPVIVDLSGVWSGALYREGALPLPFTLELQMTLESGVLRLAGTIVAVDQPSVAVVGYADEFNDAGYRVFFESADGALRAQGDGQYGPLRVEAGQYGVFAAGTLIGGGVFAMDRQAQ